MKNKNNIVRQIYLSLLRDKNTISKIVNYKDINEKTVYVSPFSDLVWGSNSEIKIIAGSITYPIDIERVRMFMFRHYTGKIEWNKVFFGNKQNNEKNT